MPIQVIPTGAPVGAEIRGVDLSKDIEEAVFAAIQDALDRHAMVYLRGQRMDHAAHVSFARRLGPLRERRANTDPLVPGWPDLTVLSNIYENGKPIGLLEAGQYWHTDNSFKAVPNGYAVLVAEEIPRKDGRALGGTMFASAIHAYDTLQDDVRQKIATLRARHNFRNPYRKKAMSGEAAAILSEESRLPDAVHPVVRIHPRTGRRCLYVNETYTVGIEGMPESEGRALIDSLCRHVTRPEAIYTHAWEPGDLLVWDDCAAQHHAIADYALPLRRKLRRATVSGLAPV